MSRELSGEMRRSLLIAALRDEKLWPPDFEWYFGNCRTCAMGLLNSICHLGLPKTFEECFQQGTSAYSWMTTVAKALDLDEVQAGRVFNPIHDDCEELYGTACSARISPEMVAKELEKLHQRLKQEALA